MLVKVLLEREVQPGKMEEAVQFLKRLRILATSEPGYISGETLYDAQEPAKLLVISTWASLDHWRAWQENPKRKELSAHLERLLVRPTAARFLHHSQAMPSAGGA